MTATPPAKRRHIARTMRRKEVLELCEREGFGERAAQTLFFDRGCPARIVLPKMKYARYDRRIVLAVLGITD